MNAILLTSGTDRQTAALPLAACTPRVAAQPGGAAAGDLRAGTAIAQPDAQAAPARGYRKWKAGEARLETALFVSVQAVMVACIVLVAVQLFATA